MQPIDDIKVLGTGTSRHQVVLHQLRHFLDLAGLDINVIEYKDVDSFIANGVSSVPSVIYQNEVFKIGTNGSFNETLRNVINSILKKNNYGKLPRYVMPIDFSDVSMNAFAYGHRLATDNGAITKALHVFYPKGQDLLDIDKLNSNLEEERREQFNDFLKKFDIDWGSDMMTASLIDGEFKHGFVTEEILESIDENKASILIMGTTGVGSRLKKWVGSVSQDMIYKAPCPVLLIPPKASYHDIKEILLPYAEHTEDELIQIVDFARLTNAKLHFVHVTSQKDEQNDQIIKEWKRIQSVFTNVEMDFEVIFHKDVAQGITNYVDQHQIDIIAVTTHEKTWFQKLIDQNISSQLALNTVIPLLVVK